MKAARVKVKLGCGLALGLECALGGVDQLAECGGVGRSQVGEDLAVHIDVGCLQALDETAVSNAGLAGGGVDA